VALRAKKRKIDAILGARLRDISAAEFRELTKIIVPVVLMVLAGLWFASRFVEPAPPKRIAIATADQTGSYYVIGKSYADILRQSGITLDVVATAGSADNVKRLLDPNSGVQVALLQGGTTNAAESPGLVSLGRLYLEPTWIFYHGEATIDRLVDLKGKRIIVGAEGSGTRALALKLLEANGIAAGNTTLLALSGAAAAEALATDAADAAFFTSAASAPQIQALLRRPDLRLMSLVNAEAYSRNFPFLSRIVLPKGVIDLVANIPPIDIEMIAPMAVLVAREDLHPALVTLLAEAAKTVHSSAGLFNRAGEFPKAQDPEFDLSPDAERAYKTGPNWLNRTLPFWLATFIERMIVLAVPLAGVLLPLSKAVPAIYKWRMRRRLLYWYGRLKALESVIDDAPNREALAEYREEFAVIDRAVCNIPIPLGFSDQYYTLRSAIDVVRQRLANLKPVAAAAEAA
jgi:TRAP transporter TAXI family solute receptor